jgi:hypothetical protein
MAKILLLDFEENDYRYLTEQKYDVDLKLTNWKSGRVESVVPPPDCRIIFYQANLSNYGTGLHAGESESFSRIVAEGGAVICFVGNCQEYHLTNIIGEIPRLKFEENQFPDKLYEIQDSPFGPIFGEFRAFISFASELFPLQSHLGKAVDLKEWDPSYEGELLVVAESFKNFPISAWIRRGKGYYLFLPWFGDKNSEVVELLLGRILPQVAPQLFAEEGIDWLDSYDYIFPSLLDVFKQMEEENDRHRQNMRRLEDQIEEIKADEQEPFNKLLIAGPAELKEAVVRALKYLNFLNVINVDEYWKHVIRAKEEDIWIVDENEKSVEELIRGNQLILVSARNGKGAALDEDCLLLQRYKGRRMQEFNNTNIKALLIGNYYSGTEAKLRGLPFTENQINEAAKDGNGLLTTYELFRAVKAEKEKKITKEAIREQLKSKVGLITFDY